MQRDLPGRAIHCSEKISISILFLWGDKTDSPIEELKEVDG